MRIFEKYAVKVGGGYNHRYNLSDGILLKDNHIGAAGGVKEAVLMAKEYAPFVRKIEVEVENLDMLKEALEAGADMIMLDNMSVEDMIEAVTLCAGKALNKRGYISSEIYYCIRKVSQKSCGAFYCILGEVIVLLRFYTIVITDFTACNYNKDGGKVIVDLKNKDSNIILSVSDTGIGIPAEHQSRIFERFYRVDKSHSKETGGTGLGLSIVKHAVAYHGGKIKLESTVNAGITITVRFDN